MPGHRLSPTAASLLGFLHDGPMTGWDLVVLARERIGAFWTLTQSQVYRELRAMAGAGLVQEGTPGPRDRKPYAITAAGRRAFAEWMDDEPGTEQIRFPLLMTMAFARHLPAHRLAEIVASQRAVHAERLASYEHYREALRAVPTPDEFRLATLEFGLRYERAIVDWLDQLPDTLSALDPEPDVKQPRADP